MLAVLQFDAVNIPLLERLLAEGRLPALAALRERGTWQRLESPATHFAAATYATLYTGREVGEHGQYYAFQWAADEQRVRFRRSFETPPTAWERLAQAGRRSLVVDPYEGWPPADRNGIVLSGVQYENYVSLERWAAPSGARSQVEHLLGRGPYVEEVFGQPQVGPLLELRRRVLPGPRRVADATTTLLAGGRFDLVWAVFLSSHVGGHQFFDVTLIEEKALAAERRLLQSALGDIYEATDSAIGTIVRALPDDCDVIVVSPIGMATNATRTDFLGDMLAAVVDGRPHARQATVPLWRLRAGVPTHVRGLITRALGPTLAREAMVRLQTVGVDWARTRAFTLPSDHHGQVRLNVRGRERDGIVDPGEADELVARIQQGLLSFRDPDGSLSVAGVDRVDDLVGRDAPARDRLPDLIVRWGQAPSAQLEAVESAEHGRIVRQGRGSGRSGAHTADAWALLVPANARVREPARPPRVADITATAAALHGLEPEGEPLLEP